MPKSKRVRKPGKKHTPSEAWKKVKSKLDKSGEEDPVPVPTNSEEEK